jgi:hypothetical protein
MIFFILLSTCYVDGMHSYSFTKYPVIISEHKSKEDCVRSIKEKTPTIPTCRAYCVEGFK